MEQRKQIIKRFCAEGLPVTKALAIAGIAKSSYYYKPTGKRKGKRPSTHTCHYSGKRITNEELVTLIQELLSQEFIDYGYKRTTHALKREGWIINIKKVYRLMKEHSLLLPVRRRSPSNKTYVKMTKPAAKYPFHIMEVDIKYIWLHWQRRHAYLITFLCVKTRFSIGWALDLTMKSQQVTQLLESVLTHPYVLAVSQNLTHQFRIRSDNGPQFIAGILAEAISKNKMHHEFIHPGTPQQNGHIEAFHSTVERIICQGYELKYLQDAINVFERFYQTYNYKRIMKGIGYKTPFESLKEWAELQGTHLKPDTCNRTNFDTN